MFNLIRKYEERNKFRDVPVTSLDLFIMVVCKTFQITKLMSILGLSKSRNPITMLVCLERKKRKRKRFMG